MPLQRTRLQMRWCGIGNRAVNHSFAERIVRWQRVHGRHALPWQRTREPYPIWISEIMLQQTQVGTVVPYFERFLARFPVLGVLADAAPDDVLRHWSGLGYYARARHLHAAAKHVVHDLDGHFPRSSQDIATLPGVGRSTAAAIAVFAFGERAAILDGNVKRVLARAFGVEGWPGSPRVETQLWALAESLLPRPDDIVPYTQGLMDLGSLVCTRTSPMCDRCPVNDLCAGRSSGNPGRLPAARPRRQRVVRETGFLLLLGADHVLLERRAPAGIWGGLWSLPEFDGPEPVETYCRRRFAIEPLSIHRLPPMEHTFTHFTLIATPWQIHVGGRFMAVRDESLRWWPLSALSDAGVPAPVRKILSQLSEGTLPFTRD